LLVPRRWLRIEIEQRETVRRELVCRNDVARERLTGQRIRDRDDLSVERVVGVQQLAEIAAPHRQGGHRRAVRLYGAIVHPLLGAEEEQFVLEGRSRDGSAKRVAVLFVLERRRAAVLNRVRAPVSGPCVRLKLVIAEKVRGASAVAVAAALRHEPDLATAG